MYLPANNFGRWLLALVLLVAIAVARHAAQPAIAAGSTTTFFLLTNDNHIAALTDALPGLPTTPIAVTGLNAGETLVDIDMRPQNGLLYGLAINASADTGTLYLINPQTGTATAVGTAGQITFVGVDLPDPATASYGFDFNPTVDRARVVTSTGLNFRINPNNGAPIGPDGQLNGATTTVDGAAYTNNTPNATATTLYTLDAATNSLYIQNPANNGTQTNPLAVTQNSSPVDVIAVDGFDIPPGVNVMASNAPASGAAYAVLTIGSTLGLYQIELSTGAATLLGRPGSLTMRGLAVWAPSLSGIALNATGTNLMRFRLDTPSAVTTVIVTGIVAGETLVGIDGRPATGQLYGLGIDAAADTGTLYLLDPQTGAAAVIGLAGQVAFPATDLPAASAGYGIDFNPMVDRIRVVTGTGLNFRINPNNGAPIGPDTPINGLPIGSTGVTAAAYSNNYAGAAATTLYTLDPTSDRLFIQNPANNGTQANGRAVTLNGSPLDMSAANGFDIPPGASVTTSNTPATGNAYAALTVGGTTRIYRINLANGAATALGALGTGATGVAGLVVWSEAPAAQLTTAATTVSESAGAVVVTVTSTGGAPLIASYSAGNGSATPGNDYMLISGTLLLGGSTISQTLSLPLINDTVAEQNETVEIRLLGTGGVMLTLTLTIKDDDPRKVYLPLVRSS